MRNMTSGSQRKLHRLWTVSEVKKLIDGVAHFGVGKWTHIKKLLFSSSIHRTPVDLKDKWRNLLKASRALKGSRIEVSYP
ncbi:putative transcription factor MYB-HB-like family [Helianthus annuus]|nr:putative transcription factor MYB-HB-like family [Helianthus annuus]